jgi:DNA polymerase (family 10)
MVILKSGIQADVRVVKDAEYGAALQYFTGSKDHNIALRTIAIKKGYKLSEYGVFDKKGKRIAGENEEDVYKVLGLKWMPPEIRENRGEIEAAIRGKLPTLVDYKDVKGDFHTHTKWSDGDDTIEEVARAAQARGYDFICISDHSKTERIAHGLDEERILKQIKEIKELNKKMKIRIFAASEVDIKADGSLDYSDDVLKQLDFAVASVHSGFQMPKEVMTERILTAMDNKYVKILGHPTGRLINARPPYEVALEKVFEKAADRKIFLEINAFPERLDLSDQNVRRAIEMGVKLTIGTDAHSKEQLRYIELGVATARRGWAEKKDILNTYPLKEIERQLL